MNVKRLDMKDIDSIVNIEMACFSAPWSKESIAVSLENNNRFLGIYDSDILCGYGSFSVILDEGYINNIGVLPKYRRNGIGKTILNEIINFCLINNLSFLSLEVRESNIAAINMYKSAGFENVGIRKNYYPSPTENAIIMTKYFKDKII